MHHYVRAPALPGNFLYTVLPCVGTFFCLEKNSCCKPGCQLKSCPDPIEAIQMVGGGGCRKRFSCFVVGVADSKGFVLLPTTKGHGLPFPALDCVNQQRHSNPWLEKHLLKVVPDGASRKGISNDLAGLGHESANCGIRSSWGGD